MGTDLFPLPRWLMTGDAAFAAASAAISNAIASVRLEVYTYADDEVGRQGRDLLVAAAARGLHVQVLVDAVGSWRLKGAFWEPLRAAGGECRVFNPLGLKRLAFRDHRKLIVCDDRVAIIGGFNVSDEYSGDGVARGWQDVGLCAEGPIAAELAESFDKIFERAAFLHPLGARLRPLPTKLALPHRGWRLLFSGPGRGVNPFVRTLNRDLLSAREVRIITPYFLPTLRLRRRLAGAARQGARVQLLLPAKTDVPLSRLAAQSLYRRLMKAGIEIYEYQPQILHAKLYLLDDAVYVGSSNLDARSLRINYELMARFDGPVVVNGARDYFEANLQLSRRVDPVAWQRERTGWQRLQQRWSHFLLATLDPLVAGWQYRKFRG